MKKIIKFILFLFLSSHVYPQAGFYQQNSGTNYNLNFINSGYVFGNNGTILYTTNEGITWQSQSSGTVNNLNSGIGIVGSNVGLAVGDNGTIIRKANVGSNWVVMNSGVTTDLKDIYQINSMTALIVGKGGLILRTTTGGFIWYSVPSGTVNDLNCLLKFISYPDTIILAAGNNGTILKSVNGGTAWLPKVSGTNSNLNRGIYYHDNISYFILAGNQGSLLFSSNQGESWTMKNTGYSQNFNSISLVTQSGNFPTHIWIGGNNGLIIKSNDLGNTWSQWQSNTLQNIHSIYGSYQYSAYAAGPGGLILHSTLASDYWSSKKIDANQISTWFDNTGFVNTHFSSNNSNTYPDGFEWPKGSNKQAIFSSGLWLVGKVQNELRGAISFCGSSKEFYPGYIDYNSQIPHGKNDTTYRIYKVSPQYPNGGNGFDSWSLWPVSQGAQWIDNNNNGIYEPPADNPLMKGDQNLFCAFTDGYPESHVCYSGFTPPLNADLHLYCYAVNNPQCADAVYMEWKIINKKNIAWDSFYVGLWSDPDLGDAGNDKTGCDTLLNLGYNYNGTPDYTYNVNPPAFGYALYKVSRHTDKLMDIFNDPRKNTYEPDNITESYNLLHGLKTDGTAWINPLTNEPSKLLYSGDPETNTGWIYNSQEDTRMLIGSYLGTVQPLDTIDFYAVAVIKSGFNIFNAVTKLKDCIHKGVIGIENNNINNELPLTYKLYQNYPNPFNPTSNIKYQIAKSGFVTLKIYDVLGKEIITLVNEHQKPNTYNIEFDGTNYPSGVYFYELTAVEFTAVKRMILLK